MLVFNEAQVGEAIYTKLKTISSSIYFDRAPRTATFPYAVFKLNSVFQREGATSTFILSINVWHNKGNNITDLVTLQNDILNGLHKGVYIDVNMSLVFMLESLLTINDPDEQLRRRQLEFVVEYNNRNV